MEDKVLYKFYATWCGPCKIMKPVVDKIASEHKLNLVEVDIDQHPELADAYEVRGVPTLVLVEDEKVVARHVGAQPQRVVTAALGLS
jgi:thioredoxin